MDGHADPKDQGGLAVPDGLEPIGVMVVGRHPEAGVELVEGRFGVALGVGPADGGVVVAELGRAGVVVVVAGGQVTGEAACDLVGGPVLELVAAQDGWGLEVFQQPIAALGGVAVGVWRSVEGGV